MMSIAKLIATGFIVTAMALFSTGCGGSSNSSNTNTSTQKTFLDRITVGIPYSCGSSTGVTDANGTFMAPSNSNCTFTLGNFSFSIASNKIGSKDVITPYDLTDNKVQAQNLAYVLHAVSDYDTDHSMQINKALAQKLPADLNLSDSEFNIDEKLFAVGIYPKPMSRVKADLARFVNEDGTLVNPKEVVLNNLNNTYTRNFPTLASEFRMKEVDFQKYMHGVSYKDTTSSKSTSTTIASIFKSALALFSKTPSMDMAASTTSNSGLNYSLTQDNIRIMSLGSAVSNSTATYNRGSIFYLGMLQTDSKLNYVSGGSSNQSSIAISASQDGSSYAKQTSFDIEVSGKYLGYSGAASYQQNNLYQTTSTSASAYVNMTYANIGSFATISTGDNTANYNFTNYLFCGNDKKTTTCVDTTNAVTDYNKTVTANDGSKITYIHDYNLADNTLYDYSGPNYYAPIKFIGDMEDLFAKLQNQYQNPGTTDSNISAHIKKKSMTLMIDLKNEINKAIGTFYQNAGESFVSKINVMNMAYGYGELNSSSVSANTEAKYAGTISASYSGVLASGSGQTSASYDVQNGMASAFLGISANASAWPAGTVDTTSWLSTINGYLNAAKAGTALSVPGGLSFGSATPSTLTSPDFANDALYPPKSCFTSYDQWKQYQADKASAGKASTPATVDTGTSATTAAQVSQHGLPSTAADAEEVAEAASSELKKANYTKLKTELIKLNSLKSQVAPLLSSGSDSGSGNIYTIDSMFVSGFETTPYAVVLPQLTPNFTVVDEYQAASLPNFPNTAKLMTLLIDYGKLDTYLNFLSSFSASGLQGTNISSNYHTAFQAFQSSSYGIINLALSSGQDCSASTLSSVITDFLSNLDNNMTSVLGAYSYVQSLMSPANLKIWMNAPGGYALISNGASSLTNVNSGSGGTDPFVAIPKASLVFAGNILTLDFHDRNTTSLSFKYALSADPLQGITDIGNAYGSITPMFPVYQFRNSSNPALFFVQIAGGYQIIYGNNGIVLPTNGSRLNFNSSFSSSSYDIKPVVQQQLLGDSGLSNGTWDYSILFDSNKNTNTSKLRSQFNLLVFNTNMPYQSSAGFSPSTTNGYAMSPGGYYQYMMQPALVQFNDQPAGNYGSQIPVMLPVGSYALLPINTSTSELFASNPSVYKYALSNPANNYVLSSYFENAYNTAMTKF